MSTLDIFEQLLFGSGAWFAFPILALLCFCMIVVYKYAGLITFILFLLLGVRYYQLYSTLGTSDLMWFWIFSWLVASMQIVAMLGLMAKDRK